MNQANVCHQICVGCELGALRAQLTDERNESRTQSIAAARERTASDVRALAQEVEDTKSRIGEMFRPYLDATLEESVGQLQGLTDRYEQDSPLQQVVCSQDGPRGLFRKCGAVVVDVPRS